MSFNINSAIGGNYCGRCFCCRMLAIVCSPSLSIKKSVENDNRSSTGSPLIIVFDSQQDRDSKIIENVIVNTIRQLLGVSFTLRYFLYIPQIFNLFVLVLFEVEE